MLTSHFWIKYWHGKRKHLRLKCSTDSWVADLGGIQGAGVGIFLALVRFLCRIQAVRFSTSVGIGLLSPLDVTSFRSSVQFDWKTRNKVGSVHYPHDSLSYVTLHFSCICFYYLKVQSVCGVLDLRNTDLTFSLCNCDVRGNSYIAAIKKYLQVSHKLLLFLLFTEVFVFVQDIMHFAEELVLDGI